MKMSLSIGTPGEGEIASGLRVLRGSLLELRLGGSRVSPGVVQSPFHVLGAPETDLQGLLHGILFLQALVQDEVGNERPTPPAAAGAMKEHRPVSAAAEDP